jgi:Protein RETICULATA-related
MSTMLPPFVLTVVMVLTIILINPIEGMAITKPLQKLSENVLVGYRQRVAADPSFYSKSVLETLLAASTQYAAELKLRGSERMIPEIDFVFAGVLTAVVGKYYSMWKTAKTRKFDDDHNDDNQKTSNNDPILFGMTVPTNAFQHYLMDGKTNPTSLQRLGSIIVPMVPLARAGFIASLIGYGLTSILIHFRTILVPSYVSITRNVNVIYASLYTGLYMAISSNIRYQILQGLVEPVLEVLTQKFTVLRGFLIISVRIGNGFLGSFLAITGMRLLGLQQVR